MANDLIITCAIVGAELTRESYPYLPLTPDEIALAAEEAVHAGASIIHLHVRDEKGLPTQRRDVFDTVTKKIKNRCDCIIQYSTGGAVGTPLIERAEPLQLKPEMATLSMGTMNFGNDVYENTFEIIEQLSGEMMKYAIMPEVEIFDAGMIDTLKDMVDKDKIQTPYLVDFVLGVRGGMSATIQNLLFLREKLDNDQPWSVTGVGRAHLPMTLHAIAMGGHIRTGIEDTRYYKKGKLAASNAQLISRVVRIAEEAGRPIADAKRTRKILGLTKEDC